MTQQQTQAANSNASNDADKKDTLYNIGGTLSEIDYRTNTNGTPYFYGKLDTVLKGRKTKITVMGFGKALENVRPSLVEGAEVRFNGHFSRGSEGGQSFSVVQLGRAPKNQAQPQRQAA